MKKISVLSGAVTEGIGEQVPYTKSTMILVESALPFTVLGILTAALGFSTDVSALKAHDVFASRIWIMASVGLISIAFSVSIVDCLYQALTGQVIIHRLITGVSWRSNEEGFEHGLSHSIHFAHSVPHTRTSQIDTDVT